MNPAPLGMQVNVRSSVIDEDLAVMIHKLIGNDTPVCFLLGGSSIFSFSFRRPSLFPCVAVLGCLCCCSK